MGLSRRDLLTASLSAGVLGSIPRLLRAEETNKTKFLFVLAGGGWDPTYVFAPMFHAANIPVPESSTAANVAGLDFVDSGSRPSVRAFLERFGDQTCFINGFEVQSVTHERCRRLLLTGSANPDGDDWPSRIAGADDSTLFPHLVMSGPAYTSRYSTSVTRVGESGQLAPLLDGTVLRGSQPFCDPISASSRAAVDAVVERRRIAAAAGQRGRGLAFADALQRVEDQRLALATITDLDLSIGVDGLNTPVSERILPAITCLERGLARCSIIEHKGIYDLGWDSHSDINMQSTHFELLFSDLSAILDQLASRSGPEGGRLIDEVVTVVISEMARAPTINGSGGKDHWTFTSAMLVGPGVAGGRVFGGFDDDFVGLPTDLASGEPSAGGTLMSTENLGATLLVMAGVDPGGFEPIEAVYSG